MIQAAIVLLVAVPAGAQTALKAAPDVPGAFGPEAKSAPVTVQGKSLDAAKVELLAGKDDGFGVLADGLSLFGMDYAHRVGRREPLRAMAADLSDWAKAPACPPDRVLIDPRTGRIRFSAGDDPAKFQSKVVARFRGTHGDNAIAQWRGNVLFLSHWESSFHLGAYDVADPAAPVKVGEIPVANFAHGFVLLDSGWALMGTTDPRGVFLLDLCDPRHMKAVRPLVPQYDWFSLVTPRYIAAWKGRRQARDNSPPEPRVFDLSRLPDEMTEVTASVKPDVRSYLAGRVGPVAADGAGWFREGDESLARIDLKGEPAAWQITRTVKLPAVGTARQNRGEGIRIQVVSPGKQFALLYPQAGGENVLQVLDVSGPEGKLLPPIDVEPTASHLSVLSGRYAYVSVPPRNRGGGIIGTWEGTYLSIYDLAAPDGIRRVGKWDPGFPTRNMRLSPLPGREPLVLIEEDSTGMGIHFADISDPLRPKVLSSVPTNGEGNRVAAWADRALFTSSTEAFWFDLANPLAPRQLSTWFNHRWFWVRHVYDGRAVVSAERQTQTIDFRDAARPRVLQSDVPGGAAWGTRLYEVRGGPRSGGGPLRLVIADLADPVGSARKSETAFKELDIPKVVGLWADGSLLYGITEGRKGNAVFLVWDVADRDKPTLIGQLRHPELEVQRGDWFWTAQGHVLAAARAIAVVTSYGSGPPQVIDARDPRNPKFLMRLPYQGKRPHHGNEMTDCRPDGPWFYIKSYPDPVQLWDFSKPEAPRQIWEEPGPDVYGSYAWQAGVPVGPILLVPQLPQLRVLTVPRPSQVPQGNVAWR